MSWIKVCTRLTVCLPVAFVVCLYILCKHFVSRSSSTKYWVWNKSKLFNTGKFLKEFFFNFNFEKINSQQNNAKSQSMQRVKPLQNNHKYSRQQICDNFLHFQCKSDLIFHVNHLLAEAILSLICWNNILKCGLLQFDSSQYTWVMKKVKRSIWAHHKHLINHFALNESTKKPKLKILSTPTAKAAKTGCIWKAATPYPDYRRVQCRGTARPIDSTVKPVLSRHSKIDKAIWYLNAGQKYCRMLPWSILQYFWPALSDYPSWNRFLGLLLSGHLRQV